MINKLTLVENWKHDPDKIYYLIKNPYLSTNFKTLYGGKIESVPYKLADWNKKEFVFERLSQNKAYPDRVVLSSEYANAENEIVIETQEQKNQKKTTFALFYNPEVAEYQQLKRWYMLMQSIIGNINSLKKALTDPAVIADSKKNTEYTNKKNLLTELFNKWNLAEYYDRIEEIESLNPDIVLA